MEIIFNANTKRKAQQYAKRLSLEQKKEIKSLHCHLGKNIRCLELSGEICKKVNDVNYEKGLKKYKQMF